VAKKKSRSQRARARARQAAANPVVRGQQAFHQGDYDAAIAAWEQALREKPSAQVTAALAEVHFRRGLIRFHREGQHPAGLSELDEAARLAPDDPRYAYHLGLAHHHQGNLGAALAAYRLALETDPSFVRAAELAVLALLEQGQNPVQTAAWKALPPDHQAEFRVLVELLGGQPLAAGSSSPARGSARLWWALAAFQSGDGGAREALLPIAQDGDEPAAVRALAAYTLGLDALRCDRQEEALGHWEAARRLGLDTPSFRDNLHQLYYAQAEEAMAVGRWSDAAALADAARSLAPGGRDLAELALAAHFHAGHAEAQAGQWHQALTYWEKTRDLGENSRELLHDLALAYEKAGRLGEAADLWRQVARRRPRKADGLTRQQVALLWGHVAECYRRAGDIEEAITTLRNAVKNDPDNVDLRLELVDALVADDRWDAADNELGRILKKEPENLGALVRSARIEEVGWRPDRAQPIWRKVLALDPNHLEARERLAELLGREGDHLLRFGKVGEALERYHEALTYTPEEPYLYLSCADCCFDQGDAEAARREMNRAFAQQVDDLDVYLSAVDLCHVRDRSEEAEWVIARAEELAGPRQPKGRLPAGFFLDLAECCFKRRQTEVGGDYVRRAERAAVGDPDGLVAVALFYLDREDEGQAVSYLDQALRLDPEHGLANLHMGMSYAGVAEMREANRHWRQARRTARRTGDQELLKMVEMSQRYFQRAIEMVERGLPPPPPLDLDLGMFDDDDDTDWDW
jgi:tetratricopeptide (TPR) repeat protein